MYTATLVNKSLRILLALITRWDLEARQLDIVNAFPNAKFDEMVYIELSNGFKIQGKIPLFFPGPIQLTAVSTTLATVIY